MYISFLAPHIYRKFVFADGRQKWQEMGIGEYVRNDRFILHEIPPQVEITIRKTYTIPLLM